MSFALNAYSSRAYQEFILPETDNIDYDVILDRDIFGVREDMGVHLEVIDGVWHFVGVDSSAVLTDSNIMGQALRDGDVLHLSVGQVCITLVMTRFQPTLAGLKKYKLRLPCQIHVGRGEKNEICFQGSPLVSQSHAVLTVNAGNCVVTDTSTNGVFLGTQRIRGACSLDFGACVNILGLQIVWLGDVLAVGCKGGIVTCSLPEMIPDIGAVTGPPLCPDDTEPSYFRRSPRNIPKLYDEKLEIEAPPQPQRADPRPLVLTIGPSLTMALPMVCGASMAIFASRSNGTSSGIFMYTGIVIAVMSALIGTMWALINLRYTKKTERQNELGRVEKYRAYLQRTEEEIAARYEYNTQSLRYLYPPAVNCAGYGPHTAELWNRNMNHADFLYLRLGVGVRPFQCDISIPKPRFSLIDDELAAQPQSIYNRFKSLKDVPVGIDLWQNRLVGVVGTAGAAVDVMRLLAVQIAANICYTDVKMVFLFDGRTPHINNLWAFARWFPHTWSEDKRVRFFAANQSERREVCYTLANVFRARAEDGPQSSRKDICRPHYVVFVERAELLEGEPVAKYLFNPEEHLGVSTVLLAEQFEQLPNSCVHIIEKDGVFRGVFNAEAGDGEKTAVEFDALTPAEAENFARGISSVEVSEAEVGGEVPESLSFLDMYHVSDLIQLNVMDRWRKNRTYENMRVPIGRKAGGADWYLDIHEKYHGPHGLVAGTTGSGKSETLQTYILSLAVNFSPADVAFFLIDFKGGGMANLFAGLPHTAGYISNLSGNQIHRAMVSIKSENRRRQRMFGEFGVNHIDQYTRLVKNGEAPVPIPHLFIVIDEFAELKRDEPDFMRELISVAQVGRSLGVHLILATQKPSGTVDDNIWSNTRFRLCLRVQDRQDSNDMLHKPDAAYITQAGRCYMQVGNDEIYELFQSGWSGAVYEEYSTGTKSEQVIMWSHTGRSALTGGGQKIRRAEARRLKWLTALADYLDEAAAGLSRPLAACLEDETAVQALLNAVYTKVQTVGYDFPRGKTNSKRLTDFAAALSLAFSASSEQQTRVTEALIKLRSAGKLPPEEREKTQLTAVVEYLAHLARESGQNQAFRLWLPVLPTTLYLHDVLPLDTGCFDGTRWPEPSAQWTLRTVVGLYDDPANQSQQPFVLDIAQNGHLAVCGTVVSGKSTFLQTFLYGLVERYSPDQVNIYVLDYSNRMLSCFDGLCHVGGVACEDTPDKTAKFFALITSILAQRKKLFQGGSFSQYRKVNGPDIPAIVVAIDNYANFREKTENKFEDVLLGLSREGVNYGIFLVITSGGFGAAEIQNRIADNIRTVVCLEMGDRFKYADVLRTMYFDVLPESNVKGRGLAAIGGNILEYQTALPCAADDDYERAEKMTRRFAQMNRAWTGRRARRIPSIPSQPSWADFVQTDGAAECYTTESSLLPYAWHSIDASIACVDLSHTYCWLITGRGRTGKTNLLKALASSAARLSSQRIIFDLQGEGLRRFAQENGARYVDSAQEMFAALKELLAVFQERNGKKRELVQAGLDEEEIYRAMRAFPPIFLFIDHLNEFVGAAYHPPEGVGAMSGFLENMMEKGFLHNIYVFATVDVSDITKLVGRKLFEAMSSYKTGIHLGGNVTGQRIFDFSALPYTEQMKTARPGLGLLPPGEYETAVREVTIPNVKG